MHDCGDLTLKPLLSRFIVGAIPFVLAATPIAAQTYFPNDSMIRAAARPFLVSSSRLGIVVGVLDADGTRRIVSVGNPDFDSRTIFEIGSVTKVFTGILLAEMTERGEVRLDEPVSALLPDSVRVPERSGRSITLVDLATHTSGLPREPDNFERADPRNRYANYSSADLYKFLRTYTLRRDPGAKAEYSNLGMGLLGHALALRADTPYEVLLRARVLEPLGLTSTAITLDDSLKRRLAPGHNLEMDALAGAGALRSSADDLLTFLAANLDPPDTPLGRAIERSHEPHFNIGFRWFAHDWNEQIGLNWEIGRRFGKPFIRHTGETFNYHSFLGFDPERRIGVVVLTNSDIGVTPIAMHLLTPSYPLMSVTQRKAFRFLVTGLAVLLVWGTSIVWRRSGARERTPQLVAGLTVVVAYGSIILAEYVSISIQGGPPLETWAKLLIICTPLALGVVAGLSQFGARLAELPLTILVGVQSFRIVLELIMHRVYVHGTLPVPNLLGWNLDLVTGILALILALLTATQLVSMRIIRAWNWLGCITLLSLLAISWSNAWATHTTLIGLPTVIVPIALLGHIAVFRKLHRADAASGAFHMQAQASAPEHLTV